MSRLTAKLFDPDFVHRGPLPLEGGTVVLRNNDVSTFIIDINTAAPQWEQMRSQYGDMKSWHVQLFDSDTDTVPLMAGIITSDRDEMGDYPATQWTGRCHLDYLDGMITLPNPASAADDQKDGSHYTDKGPAAEVIFQLVRKHVAQGARDEFQTPLRVSSTWADEPGDTVSVKSRFKPLLEEVQAAAKTGGVTFHTEMTNTGTIRFVQSVPEDRSRYIRLSEDNDALGSWSMERERPEVTKVLVAGQGEGDERTLKLVEGNTNDWGTSRIVFQDRRDTDELDDLIEAGEETLADNAESASIDLDLTDTPDLKFNRDFFIGDIVTAQLASGVTIVDGVQEAELTYSENGREGKLTIGPTGEERTEDKLVALVKDLRKRLRALETR